MNSGKLKIEWAAQYMPVLAAIKKQFEKEKPFAGMTIGMALHVEAKTANLVSTLAAGGATVHITGCNPLSTQDDVAEALNHVKNVHCYAKRACTVDEYYEAIDRVLDAKPVITIDDGMDLIHYIHTKRRDLIKNVIGGCEETTTGIHRLRAMAADRKLEFPVIAVNDTPMKRFFDNVHGTGESALSSIMITTNTLIAGKYFVVAGYGFCGRGLARKAHGLGAKVIITEVDPRRALEAHMDGFMVMSMDEAAAVGDIFVTTTGNVAVIGARHFKKLKDGAILSNAGHFNVEIDIDWLHKNAGKIIQRDGIETFMLGKKAVHVLAEGRLVNLATPKGMGHPIEVMDLSFALQALCTLHIAKNGKKLKGGVYEVPNEIDEQVANLKLASLGLSIDTLTKEQKKYSCSWDIGT
ncbi:MULTISPECIES: adenosylhomocysteinase [unclassified Methanoregula]|uniref:adenosylhomocysteinase n=1 Tax=unclassified Methanoregula TaxID=2649730 RepID=UPI0009D158E9|nr:MULTISPECIES: adenosylhomocysteinase [unclassified Methanoregula]OPX61960.1 MAG: S-adenosyl-L-homocysteine hydrolase [Methanoregula sp. PtaB.Bin085]OPY34365.1 MAG: S-adenosyl-L-homocysteine hydrolase [Methanoregula sp. PtaU1.Bin006]